MSNLIIGYVRPTAACVWVRGAKNSGDAKLRFRPTDGSAPWRNLTAALEPFRGYTTIFTLEDLQPSTDYECQLSYSKRNAKPPLVGKGTFTTAPETPRDIAFILASCNYANLAALTSKVVDVAWERIGALAEATSADFMIHCGDQIYADLPGLEFPTLLDYQQKYQSAWGRKPTARVLAQLPHYMMLDDHEIFDAFANDAEYFWRPSRRCATSRWRPIGNTSTRTIRSPIRLRPCTTDSSSEACISSPSTCAPSAGSGTTRR